MSVSCYVPGEAPAVTGRRGLRMRFLVGLAVTLAVLAGCAGDTAAPESGEPASEVDGEGGGAALGTAVPACPFDEAEVSRLVGQPMIQQGGCLFGDGNGVASLTVDLASQLAGSTTLDYSRERAGQRFDRVVHLEGEGYLAVKDLSGEAQLILPAGSYTLTMSNFERFDPDGYEQTLRALIAHITG